MLGQGAFGEVYLATKAGSEYAVKIIQCPDEAAARRAVIEAEILRGLKHNNIVRYVEAYGMFDTIHIVTEYCSKGTLTTYVQSNQLTRATQLSIFFQLSDALRYLHEDTRIKAHRDLKPDNILVSSSGTVRIADFGLAKLWSHSSRASGNLYSSGYQSFESYMYMQSAVGTRYFAAPEVFEQHYTEKSDIFSLGLIFATVTEPRYRQRGFVYATAGRIQCLGECLQDNNRASLQSLGIQFSQTPEFERKLICSMIICRYKERPTALQVMNSLRSQITRLQQVNTGPWELLRTLGAAVGLVVVSVVVAGILSTVTD